MMYSYLYPKFILFFLLYFLWQTCGKGAPPIVDKSLVPNIKMETKILKQDPFSSLLIDRYFNRPEKCPIKNNLQENLLKKLRKVSSALKIGACYDDNKDSIDSIQNLIEETNQGIKDSSLVRHDHQTQGNNVFHKRDMQGNVLNVNPPTHFQGQNYLQMNSYYGDLLETLSAISRNDECVLNIRKKGLVSVFSDIMTTIGQTASLIPTPSGLLLSAGGISLGATLKVLSSFFKSPFKWEKNEDKKQFQTMNCQFFDLRRDIESAEILSPPDETIDDKIKEIKKAQNILLEKLNYFLKKCKETISPLTSNEEQYVKTNVSGDLYSAKRQLISLNELARDALSEPIGTREKNLIIKYFMEVSIIIATSLEKDSNSPPYSAYIISLLKNFKWKELRKFNEMDINLFIINYLEPLLLYLPEYIKTLETRENIYRKKYLEHIETTGQKSNKEILEKIKNGYNKIISTFQEAIHRLDHKISVLNSRKNSKRFDDMDQGASSSYDIIQEYLDIQDVIYNRTGYSYLKFFRDKSRSEFKFFEKSYKKFNKSILNKNKKFDVRWACRDAKQLAVDWGSANSSTELVYDFLATNRGVYYSNVKKIKTFLYIFPTGKGTRYKFYRQVRASEIAKSIILKEKKYANKDLGYFGWRKSKNFGKLMLRLKNSDSARTHIESFFEENNCTRYM